MTTQPDQPKASPSLKTSAKCLAILGSLTVAIGVGIRKWFQEEFLKNSKHENLETAVWLLLLLVADLAVLCGFLAWPHLKRWLTEPIERIAWRRGIEAAKHHDRVKRWYK